MDTNSKLNFVICGLGEMGQNWLRILLENENIRVVGLVDTVIEKCKFAQESFRLKDAIIATSLDSLLIGKDVDAVLDISIPSAHYKNAKTVISQDIHLMSEKPVADNLNKVRSLVNLSRNSNAKYMVNQNYRWNPAVQVITDILRGGIIGDLKSINIKVLRNTKFDGFRRDYRNLFLLDQGIHHIDMVRVFLSEGIKFVFCKEYNCSNWYDTADSASIIMNSDNVNVNYFGSWGYKSNDETSWNGEWLFLGSKGVLSWSGEKDFKLSIEGQEVVNVMKYSNYFSRVSEYSYEDTLRLSLKNFVDSIVFDFEPWTSINDNAKTFEIVWAAIRSSKSNKPVML